MDIAVPGSATANPPNEVVIRQVEHHGVITAPSEEVVVKQDPSHTQADFMRDLGRATERVKEQPS